MGMFVNPDNSAFQVALNSEIYVDKTGLIKYTNNYCRSQKPYVQTRLTIFAARYLAGGFIGGASQSGAERKLLYGICEPHLQEDGLHHSKKLPVKFGFSPKTVPANIAKKLLSQTLP